VGLGSLISEAMAYLCYTLTSLAWKSTFLNDTLMSVKELQNIIAISETKLPDDEQFDVSVTVQNYF